MISVFTIVLIVAALQYSEQIPNGWKNALIGDIENEFDKFIGFFEKPYRNNHTERKLRLGIFKDNYKHVQYLNSRSVNNSATYGITKFFDLSTKEFRDYYLKYKPHNHTVLKSKSKGFAAGALKSSSTPISIDWKSQGKVTGVKNQGVCGACWAFAISEVMESTQAIQSATSVYSLSEQQILDCIPFPTADGCNGGDLTQTARYLRDNNKAIAENSKYPYREKVGLCKAVTDTKSVKITEMSSFSALGDEKVILNELSQRPVAVAVDAKSWQFYTGGIIQFHCDDAIDHAVQIVGFDETGDTPYYLVRNSWGEDFGNQGYLKIAVGSNVCGIAEQVLSVTKVTSG